jgi:deoxyribonuclease V
MMFSQELRRVLLQIPEGRVSTYGDVARALGDVRASKAVSDFLAGSHKESHRVVTAEGRARKWQIGPLSDEGVPISGERVGDLESVLFREFRAEHPLEHLREEQRENARNVVLEDGFEEVRSVCGFDLAYDGGVALGAFAVVDAEDLEVVERGTITMEIDFPYIPGYLTYREFPAIRAAWKMVSSDVNVLLIDGHGYAHPRRAGIACHVGVKLGMPTIGVAKSLLVGEVETPPRAGESGRVMDDDEMIGHALMSSTSKRPIYVSPGHLVSFESSVRVVKSLSRTRIPEPLRHAHSLGASAKLG